MPKKKSPAGLHAAIASGKSAAEEALAFRAQQRRKRATIERNLKPSRRRALGAPSQIPLRKRALFAPRPTAGVLIAEGDSWFDYPLQDVLRLLEDDHLFDVESVAHKGDCVEDMAHSAGQFEEFAILLNHAASSLPPLNEDIVRGVIDVRLRAAYARIISGLTAISKSFLGKTIPIITHGYDYPVPDGRGFLGGFSLLPGPWLKPGFQRKGYDDLERNKQLLMQLIDRFNELLADMVALPEFSHVHYLDLRGTLKHDATYKQFWANELHPSPRGFDLVTQKFAKVIDEL